MDDMARMNTQSSASDERDSTVTWIEGRIAMWRRERGITMNRQTLNAIDAKISELSILLGALRKR